MLVKTRMIFAAPAEFIPAVKEKDCTAAYMIYRIGRGFKLFRSRLSTGVKGGFMVLDISGFKGGGPLSALISEITHECERMDYSGVVIDAGYSKTMPLQRSLSNALDTEFREKGLKYFIPENLYEQGTNSIVRIPTALSGGTLKRHLSEASEKYGADHIAVEIERIRMDFTLPASDGTGTALSDIELSKLMERYNAVSAFSTDLAVNYFNYKEKNKTHFVLYDDALSIVRKLSLAGKLGIENAFLFYPHVSDIYDEIMSSNINV